jgi:hypothetical protein
MAEELPSVEADVSTSRAVTLPATENVLCLAGDSFSVTVVVVKVPSGAFISVVVVVELHAVSERIPIIASKARMIFFIVKLLIVEFVFCVRQ